MQELDLRVIFSLLFKQLKWIILVGAVCALLAGMFTGFFIADTYSSQFDMYISNYKDLGSTSTEGVSSSSLIASQTLVNEYVVVLSNDAVLDEVAKSLERRGYTMTTKALRSCLSFKGVDETAMLRVTVVTTDAALSRAIAQSIADVAPDKMAEIMKLSSARVLAPPKEGVKVGPNLVRNTILGGMLGAVAVCGVVILLYCLDDTVKGERDIRRRLNVVVLGEVPSFDVKKRKGGIRRG